LSDTLPSVVQSLNLSIRAEPDFPAPEHDALVKDKHVVRDATRDLLAIGRCEVSATARNSSPSTTPCRLSLLLHSPATAACSAKDLENGLTNYDGTIGGKYRIRLTLTVAQGHLAGVYVYATQLKDIHLNGNISAGHLSLQELDAEGKPSAMERAPYPLPFLEELRSMSCLNGLAD
jgi:hypothetical protein